MAKNDLIVLDTILDQRCAVENNNDRGEVFEHFVLGQVLMNYDLTDEQIDIGWVDGALDGGIDGFYTFVNGHLVTDPSSHVWPRSSAEIDLFIVSCKHHDTFQQVTMDALLASSQELFDLGKAPSDLRGKYSVEVLAARDCFATAFKKLAITNPQIRVKMIYASRGDSQKLGDTIAARGNQLKALFQDLFSGVVADFQFLGAAELVELQRRVRALTLSLPFIEHLAAQDGYIVLARLGDYARFVADENLELRRYLFDSNVRDYLNSNNINTGIELTLADENSPSFWWLNNGVTMLATNAAATGKYLNVRDIQIVNGLQTTETLFKHFIRGRRKENEEKPILIKVIVSTDAQIRDRIIRATNSQSAVEVAALHATDPIQRDIETVLEAKEWFYERRTNYFKNAGRAPARIVTPNFLAAASIALLLKNPEAAAGYKAKHTREQEAYDIVFSRHFPIQVWPVVVSLMKEAEWLLTKNSPARAAGRGTIVRKWRSVLAYTCAAASLGTFEFTVVQLSNLVLNANTTSTMQRCYEAIAHLCKKSPRLSGSAVHDACGAVTSVFPITGNYAAGKRHLPNRKPVTRIPARVSVDVLKMVADALPAQPWKPATHTQVARTLGLPTARVQAAIRELIATGVFNEQIDGIVYDRDGKEIARDHERLAGTKAV
ncbi:AIPR family protein [Paraburkholderia caledonica]|jgi:hypothetical protein|uniref:AIPR family protein n=1 Tax=Paraburkholderia caledonica TaxID=134536 RepID=UPI0004800FFD|nr:AIPR family protein [Paraburkholderia caledonica]